MPVLELVRVEVVNSSQVVILELLELYYYACEFMYYTLVCACSVTFVTQYSTHAVADTGEL